MNMMMRKLSKIIILCFVIYIPLVSCMHNNKELTSEKIYHKSESKHKLKIAILIPFSEIQKSENNLYKNIANTLLSSIDMQIPKGKTINDNYEFAIYNSNNNWYKRDSNQEGLIYNIRNGRVDIIIGPTSLSNSLKIQHISSEYHIPIFSLANINDGININSEEILSNNKDVLYLNFNDFDQMDELLEVAKKKGCEKIYPLLPSNISDKIIKIIKENNLDEKYQIQKILSYKFSNIKSDIKKLYKDIRKNYDGMNNENCVLLHEGEGRLMINRYSGVIQ